jgi:hypothetical protein
MAQNRVACILHGIPECARGVTKNVISIAIEYDDLVVTAKIAFPAFTVEQHSEISD